MENATKALLIAGGILIAIIILSIGVYLYALYANKGAQYNNLIKQTEIQKFNSNFETYIGRKNITSQEMVSIINLAKENNVIITIGGIQIVFNTSYSAEDFMQDKIDKTFSCSSNPLYNNDGKIQNLTFRENS